MKNVATAGNNSASDPGDMGVGLLLCLPVAGFACADMGNGDHLHQSIQKPAYSIEIDGSGQSPGSQWGLGSPSEETDSHWLLWVIAISMLNEPVCHCLGPRLCRLSLCSSCRQRPGRAWLGIGGHALLSWQRVTHLIPGHPPLR